jgi:hypothetical protein
MERESRNRECKMNEQAAIEKLAEKELQWEKESWWLIKSLQPPNVPMVLL